MRQPHNVHFRSLCVIDLEHFNQGITSLVVEMLWHDTPLSKISVELRLGRIDPLREIVRNGVYRPKRVFLKFIPVDPLDRIFLKQPLQQVIEVLGETVHSRKVSLDYH